MKKKIFIIAAIVLVSLFSLQSIKSSTPVNSQSEVISVNDQPVTVGDYEADSNFKDFDQYTD